MFIDHTNPDLYQKSSTKDIEKTTPKEEKIKKTKKKIEISFLKKKRKEKLKNSSNLATESIDFSLTPAADKSENINENISEKNVDNYDTQKINKKEKILNILNRLKKKKKRDDIETLNSVESSNSFENIEKVEKTTNIELEQNLENISKDNLNTTYENKKIELEDKKPKSQVMLKYQELLKKNSLNSLSDKKKDETLENRDSNQNFNIKNEELKNKEDNPYSYIKNEEKESLKKKILNKYKKSLESIKKPKRVKAKIEKITPLSNKNMTKEYLAFEFKGDAKEYFKIWIVNILLTIITLGIYSAWAKVRTNQYLYANTFLNGANFAYNADAKRILYGRVIVISFYALFYIFSDILNMKEIAFYIFVMFIFMLPWLIRQAIKFKLRNTSYRNIRFNFKSDLLTFYFLGFLFILPFIALILIPLLFKEYGVLYFSVLIYYFPIILLLLAILLFFLYYPILYYKYKNFVVNHSYYGLDKFSFNAAKKEAILIFIKIALFALLFSIILGAITLAFKYIFSNILHINLHFNYSFTYIASYFVITFFYLIFIGFLKGLIDAYLSNFVRNNTVLSDGEFKGTIEPLKLAFISSTNAILLLCSLGLLYPYTKVRYLRYKIENTHFACMDYSKFNAARSYEVNTVGEETLDFFDMDIGF